MRGLLNQSWIPMLCYSLRIYRLTSLLFAVGIFSSWLSKSLRLRIEFKVFFSSFPETPSLSSSIILLIFFISIKTNKSSNIIKQKVNLSHTHYWWTIFLKKDKDYYIILSLSTIRKNEWIVWLSGSCDKKRCKCCLIFDLQVRGYPWSTDGNFIWLPH